MEHSFRGNGDGRNTPRGYFHRRGVGQQGFREGQCLQQGSREFPQRRVHHRDYPHYSHGAGTGDLPHPPGNYVGDSYYRPNYLHGRDPHYIRPVCDYEQGHYGYRDSPVMVSRPPPPPVVSNSWGNNPSRFERLNDNPSLNKVTFQAQVHQNLNNPTSSGVGNPKDISMADLLAKYNELDQKFIKLSSDKRGSTGGGVKGQGVRESVDSIVDCLEDVSSDEGSYSYFLLIFRLPVLCTPRDSRNMGG